MGALSRRALLTGLSVGAATVALPSTVRAESRTPGGIATTTTPPSGIVPLSSQYDSVIMAAQPKHYYQYATDTEFVDVVRGNNAVFPEGHGWAVVDTGERIPTFDGYGQFAETQTPSSYFGPSGGGSAWAVECWMRPDVLTFPNPQGDLYVHWMGVGDRSSLVDGNHEWVARIYNQDTPGVSPARSNWISAYAVSWHGQGMAPGQAYTDGIGEPMQWLHYVMQVNHVTGKVGIWINGVQAHGWVSLAAYDYEGRYGRAPFRMGTRDHKSYLQGAIGKVAFYTYNLSDAAIAAHYAAAPISPGWGC